MEIILVIFGSILLLFVYLLPIFIASASKSHLLGPTIVINLFLGWTLLGWVGALCMAVWPQPRPIAEQLDGLRFISRPHEKKIVQNL